MKTVLLTSGPAGSGKTTYIEAVQKMHPSVPVISRDVIRVELFGSVSLDAYSGSGDFAFEEMLRRLEKKLEESHSLIILDCWNGRGEDRQQIIFKAKQYGAVYVHCLQFFIPVDLCVRQFMQKENTRGLSPHSVRHDHALYYKLAKDIEKDGFDGVFPINPLQIPFHNFPLI